MKIRLVISKQELIKAITAQFLNYQFAGEAEAENIYWDSLDETLEIDLITSEAIRTAGVSLTSPSLPVIDPAPETEDNIPF